MPSLRACFQRVRRRMYQGLSLTEGVYSTLSALLATLISPYILHSVLELGNGLMRSKYAHLLINAAEKKNVLTDILDSREPKDN